jgi:hypothetical protein
MSMTGAIGAVVGGGVGFAVATFGNAMLSKIESQALVGLDTAKAAEKRHMYAVIRRAVVVVDVVIFAAFGWFVASSFA